MKQLREEILEVFSSSGSLPDLLNVIQRHKLIGMGQKEAYAVLETIWIEFGCQQSDEDAAPCAVLGAVMDRVWGYCPASESIWGTSLSG